MINTISNRIHIFVAVMILVLLNTPVFAGAGHDHAHEPISKEKAGELASKNLEKLVEKGKIDKSWSGKPVNSVEKKTFSKGPEWVVTFKNESLADASKRTLYMFYTLDGHYLATNYTGN
ncbi:MAG: hypothetical protein AMJ53_13985 [Gammaproteobacteria bacterium SG8_11]|nr:MAG: hypothetical protein AMJ53_13985 [Gammaproteobacteria bacterium SG8_11]